MGYPTYDRNTQFIRGVGCVKAHDVTNSNVGLHIYEGLTTNLDHLVITSEPLMFVRILVSVSILISRHVIWIMNFTFEASIPQHLCTLRLTIIWNDKFRSMTIFFQNNTQSHHVHKVAHLSGDS